MRILICDDSLEDIERLRGMLARYLDGRTEEVIVCTSGEELLENESDTEFDLLFLDIYMDNKMNGINVARELRKKGRKGAIVLTSFSNEFGPQSYEVEAAWYLTKPLLYEEFVRAVDRSLALFREDERMLKLMHKGGEFLLPIGGIDYVETEGRKVVIHMGEKTIRVYDSLERIYQILGEREFLRPHRSYILHMAFIDGMENGQFRLRNGEKVSINRSQRRAMKEIYLDYLFRKELSENYLYR